MWEYFILRSELLYSREFIKFSSLWGKIQRNRNITNGCLIFFLGRKGEKKYQGGRKRQWECVTSPSACASVTRSKPRMRNYFLGMRVAQAQLLLVTRMRWGNVTHTLSVSFHRLDAFIYSYELAYILTL